jgi:uncharacterized protein YndB with AHSA1/START domain
VTVLPASACAALASLPMEVSREAPVFASSEATIFAPIEVVWDALAELERWPQWNPDVEAIEVDGPVAPGTVFRWKAGSARITSTLQSAERPSELGWTGKALGTRAVHLWRFEPQGESTFVRTEESFSGWAPRLIRGRMEKMLQESLDRGLRHLADEAERRAPSGGV